VTKSHELTVRFERSRNLALVVVAVLTAGGCRGTTSDDAPIVPLRNMHDQDRYDPQQQSRFFADARTMRMPIKHTVSREQETDPELGQGVLLDGTGYVLTIPAAITSELGGAAKLTERGQDRYDVYCRPCHDGTGGGQGLVVKRGMAAPPSFHDARLHGMPDGQLFATISNGVRNMPAYKAQIPVRDRWAIVSYVRALQLAQAK
jgi:mono/diheme cytochrome c family protein